MTIIRSYAAQVLLASVVTLAIAYRLGDRAMVGEIGRVVLFGISAMLVVASAPAAVKCLVTPGNPPARLWGALAVCVVASGLASSGLISLFYRLANNPKWVLDLAVSDLWVWCGVFFGLTYITAPDFFGERVRKRTKITLAAFWIGIAAFIAYLLLVRPDMQPLADWIYEAFIHKPAP